MGILGIIKIILMVLVIGGLAFSIHLFWHNRRESSRKYRFLGLTVILTVVLALLLLGLFKFGNIFAFVWLFDVLTDKLNSSTGWSVWLVRAITIPLALLLVWLLSFIFSFQKQRRRLGYGLLAVVTALMCLGMFGLTKDTYFNYQTGEAQKWYAKTPEGYHLFDRPGFDPKYQIKLELVTSEIQREIDAWQKNPKPVKVTLTEETAFFNMITGEPILWYYQLSDGSYEFFDKPGCHPTYGVVLKEVTSAVAEKAMAQTKELRAKEVAALPVKEGRVVPKPEGFILKLKAGEWTDTGIVPDEKIVIEIVVEGIDRNVQFQSRLGSGTIINDIRVDALQTFSRKEAIRASFSRKNQYQSHFFLYSPIDCNVTIWKIQRC